jgi:regulator of protease activity HflC (stomatin/prohibitin superfamily)
MAERGGFSADELDEFIPGWRDRLDRVKRLEAELRAERDECAALVAHRDSLLSRLAQSEGDAAAIEARARAERDERWMQGVRDACAPDDITFDGLSHDALRPPLPTLHQLIRSLRARARASTPTTEPTDATE